ncbi:sacsin N-terminal ATP-binding-like domain-containing protein [Variovorax guangxiensis]|uniref:sacsin N-terminal ATP-binding-like domain-containing protein n=1 Tax=Variovorax guangxiensis TaxID=1775474 RepID=UPI00285E1645|nr:hypothetical protein [Variovorax guangxiensis]MDR6857859.1 hypothetical protein [Variovorax guangxiensis]
MTKYTTNYVNLIADNLRDRYKSGFPILKELVQNADDAGAGSLVFGHHSGFAAGVDHPLLQGPALWLLNDGGFQSKDKQAIRSFGLNGKAADDSAIGKFGLGMKSVFHLCESFFYVAFDGHEEHCEILSPWFGDENTSETHQRWERIGDADRASLLAVAREQDEARAGHTWFMLWVPLRRHDHLAELDGKRLPGIIDRFPGDRDGEDLDFLSAAEVDQRLGLLLPLLRSLHTARFAGSAGGRAFRVQLQLDENGARRLDHRSDGLKCAGTAADQRPKAEHLRFLVSQRVATPLEPFISLRGNESWPKSIAILDSGKWGSVPDKTRPEGAVMFAHADKRVGRLVLQWAVFLPTEELRLTYVAQMPNTSREHRIVLHGQFFVDAGRRGIADYERLHAPLEDLPRNASQQLVLQHWNQALAQEVVLPEFLPTLEAYARANGLRDEELTALTGAIVRCSPEGESGATGFFNAFRAHICRRAAWVRSLSRAGPAWTLVLLAGIRMLPLPCPPLRDHDRPWRALPGLAKLKGVVFIDNDAPSLAPAPSSWDEAALLLALQGVDAETLSSETSLGYLTQFLDMERARYVSTGRVQDALVLMLRGALRQINLSAIRSNRTLFQRLVSFLAPDRRLAIGPQGPTARGAIPEKLYRALVAVDTHALLLPGDLGPPAGTLTTAPGEGDVASWLTAIHREIERLARDEAAELDAAEPLLRSAEQLLETLGDAGKQVPFMLRNRGLRVLRATNARDLTVNGASLDSLLLIRQQRMLFKVSDAVNRFGHLHALAAALPKSAPVVIERSVAALVQADVDVSSELVPSSSDITAMLVAIGTANTPPRLGEVESRRALVKLAVGADLTHVEAARATRYLLHASPSHFQSNDPLWLEPGGVSSPWVKLWRMVDADAWNVMPSDLGNQIPGSLWLDLNLRNVDESTVTTRLRQATDFTRVEAGEFSIAERDLILGRVKDQTAWQRLPLHLDTEGTFDSIGDRCYLGTQPELPTGLNHGLRFIAASGSSDHHGNQLRWIPAWTAATSVNLVLSAPRPEEHWRYILDQLARPTWSMSTPLPLLHSKRWLPLRSGGFISPDSVVRIPGLETDIASLSVKCGFAYAGVDSLADEVRASAGYARLAKLFQEGQACLPALAQMMATVGLTVGACGSTATDMLLERVSLLARLQSLPAWSIIERALVHLDRDAVVVELIKGIATQLAQAQAEAVLDEIRGLGTEKAAIDLFLSYLAEWRNCATSIENLKATLPTLHLLARDGQWARADALATDVFGVDESRVLDDRQVSILIGIIVRNIGNPPTDALSGPDGDPPEYDPRALVKALNKLVDPLSETSAPGAVGALLGLMGPAARNLAETWLQPLAFEDYVNFLGWIDPGWEEGAVRRRRTMGDMTVTQALDVVKPVVKIADGSKVVVKSLVGKPLQLTLLPDDQADTLLVGDLSWQVNYGVVITFRPLEDLATRGIEDIKRLLQRTAEHLLIHVFNQPHSNLAALWASFAEADQITLSVARQLILEGLQNSLQQLPRVRRHPTIEAALSKVEKARRDRASAQQLGRKGPKAEDAYRSAVEELAEVVASDGDVQKVILEGVRERIADNQYEISSIPFELFQNADDAVTEFQQLQMADARAPFDSAAIGRFVFEQTDSVARFLHWGRPVNFTGRGGSVRSEFGSDLERMLMLGATAKSDAEEVTGKFGLGFKSVLLATDSPRVWSGDLSFKVVGGCLPERWAPSSPTRDSQVRHQGAVRALRTTIVELTLPDRAKRSELGERFATLAGLLPVFARQIRKVIVDDEVHHWAPKVVIEGDCRVSVGLCRLPVQNGFVTSRILVFESALGSTVLRLGPDGVVAFERSERNPVPAIWVTAPTRGVPAYGLVLNAPFQIDTGRANLASGRAARRNIEQAKKLAQAVSLGVVGLLRQSRSDWTACAADLGCTATQCAASFWASFWRAVDLSDLPDDPPEDFRLLHEFSLALFNSVLRATGELPNGLPGADAAFAKVAALRLSVDVDRMQAVLPEVAKWPIFEQAHPKSTWCCVEVAAWLKCASHYEELTLQPFDRAALFSLLPDGCIEPDDFKYISAVISRWPTGPMEDYGWRTEFEKAQLRAEDGAWHLSRLLLRGGMSGADLMVMFAPSGARLSGDYAASPTAWNMVLPYLPSVSLDPIAVAGWILSAQGVEAQRAAARWILQNLYVQSAQSVQTIHFMLSRRHSGSWLFELTRESESLAQLDPSERTILLTRLGLEVAEGDEDECEPEVFPDLHAIHAWWRAERHARLASYDKHLWPAHADREALNRDPFDRQAWMTVFSLGLMRRIGRVTDAQNKGFLEYLHSRGWWATICEASPDLNAESWMGILREYGEIQEDSPLFEQWMDLFPRLYRVARWLDVYIHIFSTVDLRKAGQTQSLLAPGADESLSGSGVDAPTMRGMLRLGQHLIIRELLRAGLIGGPVATALAYMPTEGLCDMIEGMGYNRPTTSQEIYETLVDELGDEAAHFDGAYDIPLQLVATDASIRARVLAL